MTEVLQVLDTHAVAARKDQQKTSCPASRTVKSLYYYMHIYFNCLSFDNENDIRQINNDNDHDIKCLSKAYLKLICCGTKKVDKTVTNSSTSQVNQTTQNELPPNETRMHITAECRHDTRPSVQLPSFSLSGSETKLGLTMV